MHIVEPSLEGDILVFYLEEIQQFIFKLFGPDILLMEGINIREGHFYILNQGSIIRGMSKTNIYYSDISIKFFNYQRRSPIQLQARDIKFFFPGSKNGVQEFSFSEKSGQMIAIMGGSGVGKSTLLNVLNGSLKPSGGKITINGFDIHQDYSKIEGLIGYIPQDDLVIGELSVFQNVYHNARLCLNHLGTEEIIERVNKLLSDLDLFEIKDMLVGSPLRKTLSGGQRKRLNIALELIREPSILFVDEPTSGLSSQDSERIMILLKEQARHGRLIIINIHQPSSFIYKLFDKLWILDKGGRPVYAGNPLDAVIYFKELANHIDSDSCECTSCGNVNPEQVLEILEMRKIDASGKLTDERQFSPEELYSLYTENVQVKLEDEDLAEETSLELNFNKPGRFRQFKIFLTRNIQSKLSNRQYVIINLIQAPILALIVSLLTRYVGEDGYFFGLNKNFPSFVFMSVVVMLFQGMSLSAEEIIKDKAILQRESFLRLSRFSYINSKVAFLFFVSAVQSLLFVLTSFFVLGMRGLFVDYWLVLFLTAASANLIGLLISAGLNSVVTIYISIPLLIIPQILLCGLIIPFEDIQSRNAKYNYVPLVGDIMVSRWAFEALSVNQHTNNRFNVNYFAVEKEKAEYFIKGKLIIPEISDLAQEAVINLDNETRSEDVERNLMIVKNEVLKINADNLDYAFPLNYLDFGEFDKAAYDSLTEFLGHNKILYNQLYQSANSYKDNLTYELIDEIGDDAYYDMKREYHNEALGNLVKRENPDDNIELGPEGIRVKAAPIYRNPESRIGRAHFYAPYKFIGKIRMPTLMFNSLVIILMMLVMYSALYFNWLGKLLNGWKIIQNKLKEN